MRELERQGVWQYEEVQREFWRDAESLLHRHETDLFVATEYFQVNLFVKNNTSRL